MALYSLAAQHDPNGVRFAVLDGSPADSPFAGRLGKTRDFVPHEVREITARDLASAVGEIAAEVERRQKG